MRNDRSRKQTHLLFTLPLYFSLPQIHMGAMFSKNVTPFLLCLLLSTFYTAPLVIQMFQLLHWFQFKNFPLFNFLSETKLNQWQLLPPTFLTSHLSFATADDFVYVHVTADGFMYEHAAMSLCLTAQTHDCKCQFFFAFYCSCM